MISVSTRPTRCMQYEEIIRIIFSYTPIKMYSYINGHYLQLPLKFLIEGIIKELKKDAHNT